MVCLHTHVGGPCREVKSLLLFVGITVSWSLLVRPVTQVDSSVYNNTTRGLSCACIVLAARMAHQLLIKAMTSRLHSGTFWEQLHSTARQENILKKLAGLPTIHTHLFAQREAYVRYNTRFTRSALIGGERFETDELRRVTLARV